MILLDSNAVAERLGCSRQQVCKLARLGIIPSYKWGKEYRFKDTELEEWVENQRFQTTLDVSALEDFLRQDIYKGD